MWYAIKKVKKSTDRFGSPSTEVTVELRHREAGNRCFHVLKGATAFDTITNLADKYNAEKKEVPPPPGALWRGWLQFQTA